METSIPAAIVAAVLMVSAVVLVRSGHQSFDDLSRAWKEMEDRAGEQARTQLTVTNVTHASPYVDIDVQNDGSTRLAEFDRMDVVVEYTDTTGASVLVWIPYTDGPLATNTWTVQAIVNDAFEPGIVNPDETLQMRIELAPTVGTGTTNRLVIATDLGVSISASFTG